MVPYKPNRESFTNDLLTCIIQSFYPVLKRNDWDVQINQLCIKCIVRYQLNTTLIYKVHWKNKTTKNKLSIWAIPWDGNLDE